MKSAVGVLAVICGFLATQTEAKVVGARYVREEFQTFVGPVVSFNTSASEFFESLERWLHWLNQRPSASNSSVKEVVETSEESTDGYKQTTYTDQSSTSDNSFTEPSASESSLTEEAWTSKESVDSYDQTSPTDQSPTSENSDTEDSPQSITTPSTSDQFNREEFQKQCLERHNHYRAKHGVGPLKLNSELSAFAQEWADKLASSQTFYHRQPNKYGENLYMNMDPSHKEVGGDAVDNWYLKELSKYTFGTEPSNLDAGHLTQVLWSGSEELGVGVAINGDSIYVVCNYNPPGNVQGEYAKNVLPAA